MGHYSTFGGPAFGGRGPGCRRCGRGSRSFAGGHGRFGWLSDHSPDARRVWHANPADGYSKLGLGCECHPVGLGHRSGVVVGQRCGLVCHEVVLDTAGRGVNWALFFLDGCCIDCRSVFGAWNVGLGLVDAFDCFGFPAFSSVRDTLPLVGNDDAGCPRFGLLLVDRGKHSLALGEDV